MGIIPTVASCADLRFLQNSRLSKIGIDSTLDRYKVFLKTEKLYRTRIGTRLGSVLVLGDEVVEVVPIQSFGAKQNCSSKHLDRTSTGPVPEQIRRLNSLIDCYMQKEQTQEN